MKLIRRHGQRFVILLRLSKKMILSCRLFYQTEEDCFLMHRMTNARTYEGREQQEVRLTPQVTPLSLLLLAWMDRYISYIQPLLLQEAEVFVAIHSAYPEWQSVKEIKADAKVKVNLFSVFSETLIHFHPPRASFRPRYSRSSSTRE